jgi:hypothetical protein
MGDAAGAGDGKNVRCLLKGPGQPDLGRGGAVASGHGGQRPGLGRPPPALPGRPRDREERHEGDAPVGAGAHDRVMLAQVEAVPVLHADDRRDRLGLGQLVDGHAGDAQVADQAGLAQLG